MHGFPIFCWTPAVSAHTAIGDFSDTRAEEGCTDRPPLPGGNCIGSNRLAGESTGFGKVNCPLLAIRGCALCWWKIQWRALLLLAGLPAVVLATPTTSFPPCPHMRLCLFMLFYAAYIRDILGAVVEGLGSRSHTAMSMPTNKGQHSTKMQVPPPEVPLLHSQHPFGAILGASLWQVR